VPFPAVGFRPLFLFPSSFLGSVKENGRI
jgi:hypothetical protein